MNIKNFLLLVMVTMVTGVSCETWVMHDKRGGAVDWSYMEQPEAGRYQAFKNRIAERYADLADLLQERGGRINEAIKIDVVKAYSNPNAFDIFYFGNAWDSLDGNNKILVTEDNWDNIRARAAQADNGEGGMAHFEIFKAK